MSAPPAFVLRFQSPEDYPSIGRFADDDFDINRVIQPGKEEWEMFYEEEDLKEELPEEVLVKDAEYYKKKRKQRRTYRRKQHLMLQSLNNRFLFEARPIALDSAEEEYYARITKNLANLKKESGQTANNSSSSSSGTQFRNVLMKFVKIEGTNQSEIQVIPVADQYLFRKCIRQPDRLLDEIDAESAREATILSKRAEAYKRLIHTDDLNKNDDNTDAVKRRRAKETVDGAQDGFTYALNRAMRKRAGKSAKRAMPTSFLTDSGVDMDEIRENNYFFGNDSSVRYQDDEEDNIHEIQKNDTSYEEREREDDFRLEALDELEQPEDDYEDLDDEEQDDNAVNALDIPGASELSPAELRRLQQDRLASERENAVLKGTENLSQAMLREAEAMRRQMLEKNAALGLTMPSNVFSSNLSSSSATVPAPAPAKSTLKRPRDETSSSLNTTASSSSITEDNNNATEVVSEEQRNKVPRARFAQDATSSVVQFLTTEPSIAITANNAANTTTTIAANNTTSVNGAPGSHILSEEVVRQYIISQGGKVEAEKLVKHFKAVQQRYAEVVKDKKAALELLKRILDKITNTIEDPQRGFCIVLR